MNAASRNSLLMDEYSDEDEEQMLEAKHEAYPTKSDYDIKRTALEEESVERIDLSCFSGNLRHDDRDNSRDCWRITDGNNFRVRSKHFCYNKSKIPAGKHLMDLVAVDWFKDTKRIDYVVRRQGCAAQVASEKGLFSLVFNVQRFVDGVDEFRNSRLKLIPSVPKIVSFVSFLLISYGYCITCERLCVTEPRTTTAIGCVFYSTLVGYRAFVPYFKVLLLLNYMISFYVIFHHISQNLLLLLEQLTYIEDEEVQLMRDAVYMKYRMLKKFLGAMQIVTVAETMIYINIYDSSENYWLRSLVREWAQFCIFMYIGLTFRSKELAPHFSVMPTLKSKADLMVPPIYRIENYLKSYLYGGLSVFVRKRLEARNQVSEIKFKNHILGFVDFMSLIMK
ncbi:uncharacterized protein LOC120188451 [Hibiscus syriacus]|uniref:uncharacterized protein LOC120188451 n=1 Tax=Hibiscus syriacus TaxID=106335 RepID=UPI001920BFE5|nr:uncharacterized protein LOC120188451 [Hibiscus syriacus]